MKKIIPAISLAVFLLPLTAAAFSTSTIDCAIKTITPGQTQSSVCMLEAKVAEFPGKCGTMANKDDEVCCCRVKTEYNCGWRMENTQTIDSLVTITGGCESKEFVAASKQCDPYAKPSAYQSANTYHRPMCCCEKEITKEEYKAANIIFPQFQVPIDTIKLSEPYCTGENNTGECEIPWIANYISGVYKYGLGIAGILAAIIMMAGGLIWLVSSGEASRIKTAKELMSGGVIGLILLFGAYVILKEINPQLTSLKSISIKMTDRIELEGDSGEPFTADSKSISKIIGISCGSSTPEQIIAASKGKVTYNQSLRGTKAGDGTIYLDCSSFAKFVRECSGLETITPSTASIFKNAASFDYEIKDLKPGDLVGWPPSSAPSGNGHVLIYMGNGKFGDCHGGSGKKSGNAISNSYNLKDLKDMVNKYKIKSIYAVK